MTSEVSPQAVAGQRRRRGRWLQALALLAPAAFGLYLAGQALWVRYHRHAAEQAIERGDLLAAREDLQTCLRLQKHDPELYYLLAQTDRRAGRLDDAASDLKDCERLEGLSARVLLETALVRVQQNELDADTERFLWRLIQQGGGGVRPICETLVPFYIARYDYHKAGPCLDLWLQHEPGAVPALIMRAQTYEALGAHTRAIEDCRR